MDHWPLKARGDMVMARYKAGGPLPSGVQHITLIDPHCDYVITYNALAKAGLSFATDLLKRMNQNGREEPPMDDKPCVCGHDADEHTLVGCDSYTPTWPRLVRCPCAEFQLDD